MNLRSLPADAAELRHTYACFPSGVTAICGWADGEPAGMAASSFTPVSIEPPLVSVCVQKASRTWSRLRRLLRLGVSVLAEEQDSVCRALAGGDDRFRDVEWDRTVDGAIFVAGSSAWFDCTIHQEIEAGDHFIVLLAVRALRAERARQPLVFHHSRMRRLAS